MRCLLVDDDEMILKMLSRELRSHQLFLAKNYGEAVEILQTEANLDVVVTDCQMPGPNGVAVLCAARQHQPSARRVMFSGDPPQELSELIQKGVIHTYLPKPFEGSKSSFFQALINDELNTDS